MGRTEGVVFWLITAWRNAPEIIILSDSRVANNGLNIPQLVKSPLAYTGSEARLHMKYLPAESEENTMQLRRSRNSNAPLGRRGAARWILGTMFRVGTAPSSVPR